MDWVSFFSPFFHSKKTGLDTALCSDQSIIQHEQIKELLASATGKDKDGSPVLTITDLSEFSAKRRVEARETNPDFTLASNHQMVGSAKSVWFSLSSWSWLTRMNYPVLRPCFPSLGDGLKTSNLSFLKNVFLRVGNRRADVSLAWRWWRLGFPMCCRLKKELMRRNILRRGRRRRRQKQRRCLHTLVPMIPTRKIGLDLPEVFPIWCR